MKKIITTLFLTILFIVSHAQWGTSGNDIYNSNSGNVGVGTGTVAPTAKIDIKGKDSTSASNSFRVINSAVINPKTFIIRDDGYIQVGTFDGTLSMGYEAGYKPANQENTFIGFRVGKDVTTGNNNTGVGAGALKGVTTGTQNTAMGVVSLASGTPMTGSYNSAYGFEALRYNTSGSGNVGLGQASGRYNTTGSNNTFLGREAGALKTGGNYNVIIGYDALVYNGNGANNTAVGSESGLNNLSGSNNLYLGYNAGRYGTFSNKGWIDVFNRGDSASQLGASPIIIDFHSTPSSQKVTLNSQLKINDGTQGSGKVFTSDANGIGSWQTPSEAPSQWTTSGSNIYYTTGLVGIGTSVFGTSGLSVSKSYTDNDNGTIKLISTSPSIKFESSSYNDWWIGNGYNAGGSLEIMYATTAGGTPNQKSMFFAPDGFIGFGSIRGSSTTNKIGVAGSVEIGGDYYNNNAPSNGLLVQGNTAIGTTTASEKLTVGGRVRSTNSDIVVESNSRGLILKDTQATPHYWRITISNTGVLTTTDLGTSLPAE